MSEKEFMDIFSKRLRYYLNKYDITQVELSKQLGVGTTSVYNWCNGIKIPRKQYEQEYLAEEAKPDIQEQQGFEINEFGEIIRPVRTESQVQEQPEMVTLPNGIQIPRKQYEEEQGT